VKAAGVDEALASPVGDAAAVVAAAAVVEAAGVEAATVEVGALEAGVELEAGALDEAGAEDDGAEDEDPPLDGRVIGTPAFWQVDWTTELTSAKGISILIIYVRVIYVEHTGNLCSSACFCNTRLNG
jgi:hypothetical protein